ncbi:MAG: hypothetical protein HOV96_21530 [Nonomuraea sp.]|nr:hypothetical protein [Nonomuraea sp.]NUP60868.1 hypothetical protein [Nonomuraea sp.]NUP80124.1 hypothetical protein [Nonomuraea sp.]NUS04626.1 hypothetical protein [Nonomuraea sp.]
MDDFDFLTGTWDVVNRRRVKPLAGSDEWEEFPGRSVATRHFGGAASFDEITFPTKGWHGLTVRLYDPETRQWSIYWGSSRTGRLDTRPMVGGFEGDRGEFFGEETHEGSPVRCRFLWTAGDGDTARWEQAYSADEGQTWETNWTMDFTRIS